MDKRNFDKMMKIFGKVYEKSLHPDVLKIYFEVYEEITNDKTKFITKECLKKCKYFPRPADVFECLGEVEEEFAPGSYVDARERLEEERRKEEE